VRILLVQTTLQLQQHEIIHSGVADFYNKMHECWYRTHLYKWELGEDAVERAIHWKKGLFFLRGPYKVKRVPIANVRDCDVIMLPSHIEYIQVLDPDLYKLLFKV
jgi:hypothetical protein